MNTRHRKLAPIPYKPSEKWHLMHEEYFPIFVPDRREQVEYWYNKTATGQQRDAFRRICERMYAQDPNKQEPEYSAAYTRNIAICEVKVMLKEYGEVLSELGKRLARVWILHEATRRDKETFREIFTGAQTLFIPVSVMKADYVAPDEEVYKDMDRSNFLSSVDWSSSKESEKRQELHRKKFGEKRLTLEQQRPRVTKPKNQFDGINPLATLGYTDISEEEAVVKLREKLEEHANSDRYYTVDGCTVYVAGNSKKMNPSVANSIKGGVIATICED
ncbi:uncharacterized protein TM35_000051630 [Trypanosoma theileri]|uniref:Uncharacterized protein n=1 Tax=Trypanosoma theileri TaxID=67003 RepID=A0A1X0P3S3_9TRYP|nr:uncharacterized protein TM35_000051630 [Trypanosoma theileri]ORC91567.1 hypothetical protein TM35_000051630 [Trypanosoma theileri]